MAEVYPFRALHYNPEKIADLAKIVTQPYDKISPEMQARYHELSPHNLVRIILGRKNPDDTSQNNVYTRAAQHFRDWVESRILISQPEPALYPYSQEYSLPGQPGSRKERRGFIALFRLEDYSAGVIHRHEETLSGPKADRLELLKATRAHFGQIFVLYSDPEGSSEAALSRRAEDRPWERVADEYGNLHSVWRVTDPSTIESIVGDMRAKKLVIADGHHRYETALAYRHYCRSQGKHDDRAEYVMMTFIRIETDGLTVLPTHRVVHSLPNFAWSKFAAGAREVFDWEEIHVQGRVQDWHGRFLKTLANAGPKCPSLGVYAGPGKLALLRLRKDVDPATLLPDLPASLARLDVVILHRLLLEPMLGIDPQAVREEKNLRYFRESDLALQEVESGKVQICFLMNPTPASAVWENALAGHVLPQKSTDFYPKLLSGLTIYWLANPSGL